MIDNWLEIDGRHFDVVVTKITEEATILYTENTGRTVATGAEMFLDPLGTFYNHKVSVKRNKDNIASFDKLYDYITQPRRYGMHIKAVHNQTTIEYDAYVSSASRTVRNIDDKNKKVWWDAMDISIIAMKAQVTP